MSHAAPGSSTKRVRASKRFLYQKHQNCIALGNIVILSVYDEKLS